MAIGKIEVNNIDVSIEFDEMLENAAKDLVKDLKISSPKKSGEYARGWTYQKVGNIYVIYNKTRPTLTHLLEYGHLVRSKKKGYVRVAPQVHMESSFIKIVNNIKKYKDDIKIKY